MLQDLLQMKTCYFVSNELTYALGLVANEKLYPQIWDRCSLFCSVLELYYYFFKILLEYTMLCQFLPFSRVNWLYICLYSLFFKNRFFPHISHINHYRVLSRVSCAIQEVLIIYFIYRGVSVPISQFIPPPPYSLIS